MGDTRTRYTYEFKLKVLVALDKNNGNIFKTAQEFGIPRQTVSNWVRDRENIFEMSELLGEQKRLPLHRRLNLLINQISDALPDMVENARLGDATRALATLIPLSESLKAKKDAQEAEDQTVYERLEKMMKLYEGRPEEFARRLKMVHDQEVELRERNRKRPPTLV
jgi:transposase-like protein